MKPEPDPDISSRRRRSIGVVAVLTLAGAVLRAWPPGHLGLTHFDEGIYAMAGNWAFAHGGLAAISPSLIPYAPPGFTILIGFLYAMVGMSDVAAIAVSQLAGTACIPVVAWLASRTYGPGSGVAAAALAACSGPHIAFSRMALTDSLFLLAWLLAIGAGQRFLERPGPRRAVILGLAVGLAQQCKYNGWLAGGIVAAAALTGITFRPEERPIGRWARPIGWGLVAAIVAAAMVWPWYHFVEQHGGYGDLLRHQRSYLGGFSAWWPNLRAQLEQSIALSGGWKLGLVAWTVVTISLWSVLARRGSSLPIFARWGWLVGVVLISLRHVNISWWFVLATLPMLVQSASPALRVFGLGWLVLSVLTPFYHPYARLWLPLHALGWIAVGGLVASLNDPLGPLWAESRPASDRFAAPQYRPRLWRSWWIIVVITSLCVDAIWIRASRPLEGLFDASDSLRGAVEVLAERIPDEVMTVKLLARPSVTFYLGGKKATWTQEGLESMARPADPRIWALYDEGLGLSPRPGVNLPPPLEENWEVVASAPTTLALPTLLDIDPAAARSKGDPNALRRAVLWLLRPRRAGGSR